ncbi:sigma-54-dependent Fis family transcriptional regulator [Lichenicola cladoniae]|uniref:Sigma-54-dependent Fis family transcriptional regulator n=1 Tax=Lichenicola cladoniae TaxID=1484109 RepID=A0A6M8HVY1_9PROT|nr:sigma-54-dependent Fis family transcriptional regulator [Acetobacteraceae bacterium]QKE92693.1 sigma-54-dependent Fis family transcriptional regulator [Lichenicola cladoniae]
MAVILIVDDDAALREGVAETLSDLGHVPLEAADGQAALATLAEHAVDAVLLDLRMPGLDGIEVLARIRARPDPPPVAILTAVATASNTIEAMRLGAVDHLTKPLGRADLAALLERMLPAASFGPATAPVQQAREELIGASPGMRDIQKTIGLLADSDATVLIAGETGTGKEVVARAIHRHGRRRNRAFIAINCAAIPSDLLESQLFGHVRGAFTGAVTDRAGSFREADGGTLFLDEIGDMAPAMQAKLLRVVQERVVQPVGGKPVPVDVRIVAASHRDLEAAVRQGSFREDLFYRLRVVPMILPPLRDRLSDILPLAEHFLGVDSSARTPHRLSRQAASLLLAHPWPGNVRELQNAMQRVIALVRRPVIEAEDLRFLGQVPTPTAEPVDWLAGDLETAVARLEAEMIRRALARSGGNRAEAARQLGIHRQLLHAKLRRQGGEPSGNRTEGVGQADDPAGSS